MGETYVTDEMRSLPGRPFREMVSFPVTASDIRRWAIAVHYPDPPPRLYWDEEYAAGTAFGGIVAPEDFNPFAWASRVPEIAARPAEVDPNFFETLLGARGPGLARLINAGVQISYGERIRPGDVIRTESRIRRYEEKQGQTHALLLTHWESTWTNQSDEHVKQTEHTTIRF